MVSWYLKYRPQTVSEIDKEDVREAISLFLKKGNFPHAMLFAGPKGTGKTSTARIIAKILNCEASEKKLSAPCNKCASCKEITTGSSLSVIELDGASNRGIDDVRAIREQVRLTPPGRFKVYIIDEAQMLTNEAANALLKTLEEPPPRVVFILATTSPEKIPETIKSRATVIHFKKAKKNEIIDKLQKIRELEKINVTDETLEKITKFADGSFRDGTKLLEQTSLGKSESTDIFFDESSSPANLISLLSQRKTREGVEEVNKVAASGVSLEAYVAGILERLHEILLYKVGVLDSPVEDFGLEVEDIKKLVGIFSSAGRQISLSPIPVLPVELGVVEWGEGSSGTSQSIRLSRNSDAAQGEKKQKSKISPRSEETPASHPPHPTSITEKDWKEILAKIKPRNHSLEALLRSTRPVEFDGETLTVSVFYQFHKEKLEEEMYRKVIEEEAGKILGSEMIRIAFVFGGKPRITGKSEDLLETAEEIFGGKFEN